MGNLNSLLNFNKAENKNNISIFKGKKKVKKDLFASLFSSEIKNTKVKNDKKQNLKMSTNLFSKHNLKETSKNLKISKAKKLLKKEINKNLETKIANITTTFDEKHKIQIEKNTPKTDKKENFTIKKQFENIELVNTAQHKIVDFDNHAKEKSLQIERKQNKDLTSKETVKNEQKPNLKFAEHINLKKEIKNLNQNSENIKSNKIENKIAKEKNFVSNQKEIYEQEIVTKNVSNEKNDRQINKDLKFTENPRIEKNQIRNLQNFVVENKKEKNLKRNFLIHQTNQFHKDNNHHEGIKQKQNKIFNPIHKKELNQNSYKFVFKANSEKQQLSKNLINFNKEPKKEKILNTEFSKNGFIFNKNNVKEWKKTTFQRTETKNERRHKINNENLIFVQSNHNSKFDKNLKFNNLENQNQTKKKEFLNQSLNAKFTKNNQQIYSFENKFENPAVVNNQSIDNKNNKFEQKKIVLTNFEKQKIKKKLESLKNFKVEKFEEFSIKNKKEIFNKSNEPKDKETTDLAFDFVEFNFNERFGKSEEIKKTTNFETTKFISENININSLENDNQNSDSGQNSENQLTDNFENLKEKFEEGNKFKNSFNLNLRLNDLNIKANLRNKVLNLVINSNSSIFTNSNLTNEIRTILMENGFKNFNLTIKEKGKRIFEENNLESNFSEIKYKSSKRREINVRA